MKSPILKDDDGNIINPPDKEESSEEVPLKDDDGNIIRQKSKIKNPKKASDERCSSCGKIHYESHDCS